MQRMSAFSGMPYVGGGEAQRKLDNLALDAWSTWASGPTRILFFWRINYTVYLSSHILDGF